MYYDKFTDYFLWMYFRTKRLPAIYSLFIRATYTLAVEGKRELENLQDSLTNDILSPSSVSSDFILLFIFRLIKPIKL